MEECSIKEGSFDFTPALVDIFEGIQPCILWVFGPQPGKWQEPTVAMVFGGESDERASRIRLAIKIVCSVMAHLCYFVKIVVLWLMRPSEILGAFSVLTISQLIFLDWFSIYSVPFQPRKHVWTWSLYNRLIV